MLLFTKFKETIFSVVPISLIVVLLGVTIVPLGWAAILKFLGSSVLVIIGLTLFLVGVDVGITPLGQKIGSALTSKKNLLLLLGAAALIGFLVTMSEPDIQVFAQTIASEFLSVEKNQLIIFIASGVGVFIMLGLLRTVLHIPLKLLLVILYLFLFVLTFLSKDIFLGVAFDSGGATTGPLTVPFILALGVGVSNVVKSSKTTSSDTFGLTGVTSIGPIMAVLIYSLILPNISKAGNINATKESLGVASFILSELKNGAISITPLFILLIFFQVTMLKLPRVTILRLAMGLVWSYIGLVIFLLGVNSSFMEMGLFIGTYISKKAMASLIWKVIFVLLAAILGAVVILAEPAVAVLTSQVEDITGGTIKKRFILVFLCIAGSVAVALAIIKAIFSIPLIFILTAGYLIALILMAFCPNLFTAIAFDSGGVASGPITSTFILSFTLGATSLGGDDGGFGVIALVALAPLVAIQILGIIYQAKVARQKKYSEVTGD